MIMKMLIVRGMIARNNTTTTTIIDEKTTAATKTSCFEINYVPDWNLRFKLKQTTVIIYNDIYALIMSFMNTKI